MKLPGKWLANMVGTDSHVIPLNDLIEHTQARTCVCNPYLEDLGDHAMVIHHSADGREYFEKDMDPKVRERPN